MAKTRKGWWEIQSVGRGINRSVRPLLDVVFPRDCLSCGEMVPGDSFLRSLCDPCSRRITLADSPGCPTCGYPMFGKVREDHECPHCHLLRPVFRRGFTFSVMRGPMRELIHHFKYQGNGMALDDVLRLAPRLPKLQDFLAGGGFFVPVPLHPRKKRERGFNQAELIAGRLEKVFPGWTTRKLLRRVVDTPTQTLLDRADRQKNLKNAFAIRAPVDFDKASRLIIIDDVFTTGSTLNACASTLRRAGIRAVDVLTLSHG